MATTLPHHDIDMPDPRPRKRGMLLDSAPEFPADQFMEAGTDRTALGAEWLPYGAIVLRGDEAQCDTEYDKEPRDLPAVVEQPAFMVYDQLICSTLGISMSTLAGRVWTNLDDFVSAFVMTELVTGALSGGLGLIGNVTYAPNIVTTTAVPLSTAIANLEARLAAVQPGAVGMIHLTPGLFNIARGLGLIDEAGDHFETATGHIVTGDSGQTGTVVPQGGNAAAAGTAWIYASSLVYWRLTPIKGVRTSTDADGGAVYIAHNDQRPLGERFGVLLFDPNVLAAAKATIAYA